MTRTLKAALVFGLALVSLVCNAYAQLDSFAQAMALFRQRNWKEAANAFADVERGAPGKTDALLYQGKALINLADMRAAEHALTAYRSSHPNSDDGSYLLAFVYFRENKPRESLEMLTVAARLKPPAAADLKVAALDYVLLDDYVDAVRYLEEALRIAPDDIEALYHLGRVFYQQNRFDQAIQAFQAVLARNPNHLKAQDNLGLCLEAKNQMDEAIAAYGKAIDLDRAASTHSEQPYLNLGALLVQSNHAEQAVPLLQTAEGIDVKSAKVRYVLGKAYFNLSRLEDAQREVEESIRLDPQDSAEHYLLGRIYHRLGKTALSVHEFSTTDELIEAKRNNSSGKGSGMGMGVSKPE